MTISTNMIINAIRALGFDLVEEVPFTTYREDTQIAAVRADEREPFTLDPRLQALAAQCGLSWYYEQSCETRGYWVLDV